MSRSRRGRANCFAVGCIAFVVLGVLVVILGFAGIRWLKHKAAGYLADEPSELPVIHPTDAEVDAVNGKFEQAFVRLLDGEPSVLLITARDLNVLVASQPDWSNHQGRVYFDITNDTFAVRVSVPIEGADAGIFQGKWLNGEARVSLAVSDNQLEAYVREVLVNDQPIPELFMSEIRAVNMLEDAREEMTIEVREVFNRIDTVEIRDGQLRLSTTAGTDYLAEAPLDIPPPAIPPEKKAALRTRVGTFHAAAKASRPAELRLSRDELNLIIDSMELAEADGAKRPLVEADIAEGAVRVRGSVPLATYGIDSAVDKYLNGDANLLLEVLGGRLSGRLSGTRVNGNALPAFLKQAMDEADFFSNLEMDEENTDPDVLKLIESVSEVRVEGDRLVFRTGTQTQTNAPAEPTPTEEPSL